MARNLVKIAHLINLYGFSLNYEKRINFSTQTKTTIDKERFYLLK